MDSSLFKRWQQQEPPFNQMVLYPQNPLSLPQFNMILFILIDELKAIMSDTPLFHFLDWHEHDGWIIEATPANWDIVSEYATKLLFPIAIEEAYTDDVDVYHAYYPEDFSFLLRVDTFSEEDGYEVPWDGAFGRFDFTASLHLVSRIRVRLETKMHLDFMIEPAQSYFDRTYAG